jgi:hypothetical protein
MSIVAQHSVMLAAAIFAEVHVAAAGAGGKDERQCRK